MSVFPFIIMFFFFQAEDGIRDDLVTGVQTCALPIYLSENSFHRKIFRIQNGVSRADSGGVMRVAGSDHGQIPDLCVLERVTVVATQSSRRVENFDRINRQRFQDRESDSSAEEIVGMRRNREAAALMNDFANFPRWFSFQIR